jgi:hypothetical protein
MPARLIISSLHSRPGPDVSSTAHSRIAIGSTLAGWAAGYACVGFRTAPQLTLLPDLPGDRPINSRGGQTPRCRRAAMPVVTSHMEKGRAIEIKRALRNWDETSESVEKNQGLVKNAIIESGYRSPRRVSIDILMR